MLDPSVTAKLVSMTEMQMFAHSKNVYRETLRALLNTFGNLYCPDADNNLVKIKCVNGRQDRSFGRDKKDNTLVLPLISISKGGSTNNDSRRRNSQVIINEKSWDPKTMRAIRILSLAPRPVNLSYKINITTKFEEDMDIIVGTIYSMFNPDLSINTSFSDYTKAYIESDDDESEFEADDGKDRKLRRSITISVETYISSPKFLYTSNGNLEYFNADVKVFDNRQDIETDSPVETVEVRHNL